LCMFYLNSSFLDNRRHLVEFVSPALAEVPQEYSLQHGHKFVYPNQPACTFPRFSMGVVSF
jgi:hypothetical protein